MKKTLVKILTVVAMLCMMFAVGCASNDDSAQTTIALTEKVSSLAVGQTHKFGYTVSPESDSVEVEWNSTAADVASIAEDGTVTALKAGATFISVTVKGTEIKDSVSLLVKETVAENPAVSVEITNKPDGKAYEGTDIELGATLTGESEGVCTDEVMWSSSNNAIASVDLAGKVTPRKVGTATITASVLGNSEISDEFVVNVYPAVPQDGIYKDAVANASIGGAQGVLTVATFDSDILLGGTRYASVSYATDTEEGHEGKLLVNGTNIRNYDRTYFELKHDDILDPAKTYYATVKVTLVSATDEDAVLTADWMLCWWDNARVCRFADDDGDTNKSMASTNETGRTIGKFTEVGETKVFTVNTEKPIRGVSFGTNQTSGTNCSYTLRIEGVEFGEYAIAKGFAISNKTDLATVRTDALGESAKSLAVKCAEGIDASQFDILYSSSDESVLTVDEDGKITPVAPGTATVTAKVKGQESTASDSVEITVEFVEVENIIITHEDEDAPETLTFDIKDAEPDSVKVNLGYRVTNDPCPYEVVWTTSDGGGCFR